MFFSQFNTYFVQTVRSKSSFNILVDFTVYLSRPNLPELGSLNTVNSRLFVKTVFFYEKTLNPRVKKISLI